MFPDQKRILGLPVRLTAPYPSAVAAADDDVDDADADAGTCAWPLLAWSSLLI